MAGAHLGKGRGAERPTVRSRQQALRRRGPRGGEGRGPSFPGSPNPTLGPTEEPPVFSNLPLLVRLARGDLPPVSRAQADSR